jgi:hypothetical protein
VKGKMTQEVYDLALSLGTTLRVFRDQRGGDTTDKALDALNRALGTCYLGLAVVRVENPTQ